MFQDEARFGRIADIRRCWAPKPMRPLCQAMLTHQYTYAYSAVDVCTGELDSLILPHVNTACMQLFLDEVSARHPDERIVMVVDDNYLGQRVASRRDVTPGVVVVLSRVLRFYSLVVEGCGHVGEGCGGGQRKARSAALSTVAPGAPKAHRPHVHSPPGT